MTVFSINSLIGSGDGADDRTPRLHHPAPRQSSIGAEKLIRGAIVASVARHVILGVTRRLGFEFHLDRFVQMHAIFELQAFNFVARHACRVKVLSSNDGRFLYETISHCFRQRVVNHHVLEGNRPLSRFDERRRRQFQSENSLQVVDRPYPRAGATAVRFVQQQHKVSLLTQILEVALSDVFRQKRRILSCLPPRTSLEIFEMLKMLILQSSDRSNNVRAWDS